MKTQATDTHPDAEKVQVMLAQQATTMERLALMRSLSQTVIQLSRRAIRRAHPTYSQRELDLAFVASHYGEDLAKRLAQYLELRDRETR